MRATNGEENTLKATTEVEVRARANGGLPYNKLALSVTCNTYDVLATSVSAGTTNAEEGFDKVGNVNGVLETGKTTDPAGNADEVAVNNCIHENTTTNDVTKLALKHDAPKFKMVEAVV